MLIGETRNKITVSKSVKGLWVKYLQTIRLACRQIGTIVVVFVQICSYLTRLGAFLLPQSMYSPVRIVDYRQSYAYR